MPDMSYWLNGKRLFLKGAWYPMSDYFGSEPTEETYIRGPGDVPVHESESHGELYGHGKADIL